MRWIILWLRQKIPPHRLCREQRRTRRSETTKTRRATPCALLGQSFFPLWTLRISVCTVLQAHVCLLCLCGDIDPPFYPLLSELPNRFNEFIMFMISFGTNSSRHMHLASHTYTPEGVCSLWKRFPYPQIRIGKIGK